MHRLDRPRGRIAYDLYGAENTGPLVVCVPGMFDHRHSFRFVGAGLAGAGYRVAAMDLRGHGDSDTTFDAYTNRAAATDAIALAEELGGRDVVMVGNSLGGAAVAIAARERPDLVAGIALLGPFLRPPAGNVLTRTLQRVALMRPWGPAFLTSYYDKLHTGRTPEGHERQLELLRQMLRPTDRYRAVHRTVFEPGETVTGVGASRAGALVIMGEQDSDWKDPRAEAEWAASVVRGSVLMVPECGHYAQAQRPDVVVPALRSLAEEVVAGA
ncbi:MULTISPECIES: alpha/beta fold hydrolase [unclassified Nocardiopsis]|uniref:alpha/beta fold hydrolase n=1 Tax=unclassified Nocardiopsis TaxID=2649073 RepID=UPI001358F0B2|nr:MULTISPECIES: alpha/beta fold hydrolase [unclassified Nocardiopsis]